MQGSAGWPGVWARGHGGLCSGLQGLSRTVTGAALEPEGPGFQSRVWPSHTACQRSGSTPVVPLYEGTISATEAWCGTPAGMGKTGVV